MPQTDSIAIANSSNFTTKGYLTRNTQGKTPAKVLSELPYQATEEQKDSAIQANFKVGKIEYNTCIDTLTTFGLKTKKVRKPSEVKLSDQSFFAGSKYYHPELGIDHSGVMGDPAPYHVSNDNIITGLLIFIFITAMILVNNTRHFIFRQTKGFFYTPRSIADMPETTNEVRLQLILVAQTALLAGLFYYMYVRARGDNSFLVDSQLLIIGIYTGIFALYFLLKGILYSIVNWVFFDKHSREQWWKAWLYLTALEGVLLFPLVLLLVYFNLSMQTGLMVLLIVVIFVKMLSLYKAFHIFFKRTKLFLQFFLYFCALEFMPMAALLGVMAMISTNLELNF